MPGISGIEVTKRLKDVRPGLFIFLISGFDDPNTAAQAQQAGADAYLTKPFSPGRFFEALADCLQRRTLTADESSNVRNALHRIVIGLEENFHAREDLFQEARVHFWLTARQYPDRPLGWYLKSVRFHLHHFRVSGRSVDSPKRRGARSVFSENWDGREQWRDILEFDEGIMSSVNARDVFSLLRDRVKPCDRKILGALAEGFGVRDIEARLKMPHQNVIRSRKRIAALAIKLGVVPPLAASVLLSPGV